LDPRFDPAAIEADIFAAWQQAGAFRQRPAADDTAARDALSPEIAEPYVITIPPPNVTGSLHMGHALNNTLQDVLIRKNRMAGRPTRWVVGTDHAGIATQNKVEQKLAKEGLTRFDVGREAFIEACWEWRREHGGRIIQQLRAMGCSCDFDDEWFTMNESYQRAVREVFVDWYRAGLIYRGTRIINWCPRCTTALSDIEVEHQDKDGKLWSIDYPLTDPVDGIDHITVATTRPETMLGDVAVAVHPDDERYRALIGSTVVLPLMNRAIPIIADEYVDPAFGTGAVKITPAHDPNDYEVGERHGLEQINVLDERAFVNENGGKFAGLERDLARKAVLYELQQAGYLSDSTPHTHAVGVCYRCGTAIEPWLSDQWFVDMKPLAEPAIQVVRDGRVRFTPTRWENVYYHWMENIRDWCISRQLWWGHRIPVFYCTACGWHDALKTDETICPQCGAPLVQDEDVLDTWFSSQLWPFATLGWPAPFGADTPAELAFNYPTSALSTARDILFLWVARMIMSGLYFAGDIPFSDVIIHPTVFNKEGKRMSKSLGTGVDPLDLMADYGADGMRFGLMLQVTGVQDLRFNEEKLLKSRDFANKIWNAARFVLMNAAGEYVPTLADVSDAAQLADRWILSRLAGLARRVDAGIDAFEFGEVTRELFDFAWTEYCDWYIELAKGRLAAEGEAAAQVRRVLLFVLDTFLRLLHPFMPFITEAIWQKLPRPAGTDAGADLPQQLITAAWPDVAALGSLVDADAERRIQLLQAVVTALRSTRARYGLSPRKPLAVLVRTQDATDVQLLQAVADQISTLGHASDFAVGTDIEKPAHSAVTVAAGLEIYLPLEGLVDFAAERARLEKERAQLSADAAKLEKKLSNPGYLAKAAPEIIEKDRARAAETASALAAVDAQLTELD
jgi:valyl-tRNA synthetase